MIKRACSWLEQKTRNLVIGIHNLITWAPVIWKDRDYGGYYVTAILQKKLGKMLEFSKELNEEELTKELQELHRLATKVHEDDYMSEVHPEVLELVSEMGLDYVQTEEGPEMYTVEVNNITEEEIETIALAYGQVEERREEDLDKLFKGLTNNVKDRWE